MTEIARPPTRHATTQAADGLPRIRWTLAEFERLSELGFFGGIDSERERVELIDGEIVPMQAKSGRHEWVRSRILRHLMRSAPDGLEVFSEPGWRPGGDRYVEPEIVICREGLRPDTVPPAEVLLLIEVSDSTLRYDSGTKARVYASAGVREYWVVDARALVTKVHREPREEGYASVVPVAPGETLRPHLLPALALSIGELGID